MTAPQPYNVQEEKNREESQVQEEQHQESLHEQIDNVLFELFVLSGSLGTVGELMLDAPSSGSKCDSMAVGQIIDHYTGLINDGLGRIEKILTDDMRRGQDEV